MSDRDGPWRPAPQAPPPNRRLGLVFWLALASMGAIAIWALARRFPGAVGDGAVDAVRFGLLTALAVALLARLRMGAGQTVRTVGLWLGIILVLVLSYSYRNELGDVGLRVRGELQPGRAMNTAPGEMVVARDGDGHFTVQGRVNGHPVLFLVDTGASGILLSPDDARRAGVDVSGMRFDQMAETANGVGRSAKVTVDRLEVGDLSLRDVEMSVNQAPLSVSLLGMTFFNRLESFQVKGDRLYLKWRG